MSKAAFFNAIRPVFGGRLTQGQVEGMNFLLDYRAKNYPQVTDAQMAYILASTYWETAHTMQPVTEYGSQSYLRGKRYWPYIGRGYCQLTHRENYAHYGLADHPEKALEPETAAHVLFDGILNGVFGGKLGSYVNANKCDYVNARRCVNVLDRAKEIAAIANKFKSAIAVAAKAPVEVASHGPTTKTVFDEIGDFIDWTRHPEEAARQVPPPSAHRDDALHVYLVPAIIAFIGALASADWNTAFDNPQASILVILTGAAAAAYQAAAPWWLRAVWRPKLV